MKLILLSDLHLVPPGELARNNFDVNAHFSQIIQRLKQEDFDLIINLGDTCCKEPELTIYQWFFKELSQLNKPLEIIAGNHDDSELMIKNFNLATQDSEGKLLYFSKKLGDQNCLFLDTSMGVVSNEQLLWLKEQLSNNLEDLLIFMHHPPCFAGVPFMDNRYALKNYKTLLQLFQSQNYKITIFTGHYHVDKTLQFSNCHIHICPSSYYTLDQTKNDFFIEEQVPCYKIVELDGKEVYSKSVYLKKSFSNS